MKSVLIKGCLPDSRVERGLKGACIEWNGANNGVGYGVRKVPKTRRNVYVHRAVWEEVHGPIPKGMCVLHHCDNPSCYNIDHLFLGTKADNNRDASMKGRSPTGDRHPNAKLSWEEVTEIRSRLRDGETQTSLAKLYGVSQTTVGRIEKNERWREVNR